MYQYPYGNAQQLNLDWLMEQWQVVKENIDGSLQGEIDRVEAAITDLLTARDAAVAAAGAAGTSASAAAQSAQAAAGDAAIATAQAAAATQERVNAAQFANAAQGHANAAQAQATAAQNAAGQAAASASQAAASADDAYDHMISASGYATNAATSAAAAQQSFTLADAARQAAQGSASDAADSAQEAQDILDSIPEDYSDLSDDVSELQTAITLKTNKGTKTIVNSIAGYDENQGVVEYDDSWWAYNNPNYKHIVVPITGTRNILKIKAGTHATRYEGLTEYAAPKTSSHEMHLGSYWVRRIDVDAGKTLEAEVPPDVKYIAINSLYNTENCIAEFELTSYDYEETIQTEETTQELHRRTCEILVTAQGMDVQMH